MSATSLGSAESSLRSYEDENFLVLWNGGDLLNDRVEYPKVFEEPDVANASIHRKKKKKIGRTKP